MRNNVWSYCYAKLGAAMRKPFRNLMERCRTVPNVRAECLMGEWCVNRWKKTSPPRDSPTVFRATTPPPPDNDSFNSSISSFFTTSPRSHFFYSYPWVHEIHRNYVPPHRFQILRKSITFWCAFKKILIISSVHHLAEYSISWVFLQLQMPHLPEAMSCSVRPQGASEEGSAIVGSPAVESKPS